MRSRVSVSTSRLLTRRRAQQKLSQRSTPSITENLFQSPHQQWLDTNGEPLTGGMLYVYQAGTSTATDTWQDADLTIVNTNPVILDSSGFASVWLDPNQVYKFRMTNSTGVQQWTIDDYAGGALTANILVPLNYLLPATGPNDITNGGNQQQWLWQFTGPAQNAGLVLSEPGPSTGTWVAPDGSGRSNPILDVYTVPGSTASPIEIIAHATDLTGAGLAVLPNGDIKAIGGANFITNITGIADQCVQADINGRLFGTGVPCGSGGGGIASIVGIPPIAVSTVDGVATISIGAAISSLTMSPASVLGGSNSTGTVALNIPAPTGGAVVSLSSSNPSVVSVPASVTVAANATTATFTATTTTVASNTTISISGSYSGVSQSVNLTVTAAPVASLASIALNPTSVLGGSNSTGTVTLTHPAPAGGAVVTLSSGNASVVHLPASVTVVANTSTAQFTATTSAVTSDTTVAITGNYSGVNQSANLAVTAPVPVRNIWGGYAPANDSTGVTGPNADGTLTLVPYTADDLSVLQTTAEQVGQSWSFTPATQCICLVLYGGTHMFVDENGTGVTMVPGGPSPAPTPVTVNGVQMYLYCTQFLQSAPITIKVSQ